VIDFEGLVESFRQSLIDLCGKLMYEVVEKSQTTVDYLAKNAAVPPGSWNATAASVLETISEDVIMPIAILVFVAIMFYELVTMYTDKNKMRKGDVEAIFIFAFKCFLVVLLMTNSNYIVTQVYNMSETLAERSVSGFEGDMKELVQGVDPTYRMTDIMKQALPKRGFFLGDGDKTERGYEIGTLGMLFISLVASYALTTGVKIIITVILCMRAVEMLLAASYAPLPFSTMMNRDLRNGMGNNFVRNIISLTFQIFIIVVVIGLYAGLMKGVFDPSRYITNDPRNKGLGLIPDGDYLPKSAVITMVANSGVFTVLTVMMVLKSGTISKSIFQAG